MDSQPIGREATSSNPVGGTMKSLLGSVALIAMSVSVSVHAADMAVMAPPSPAYTAPYNWSGLYLGANIGGAFSSATANVAGTIWDPGATEFIGGFQVGYNWQFGHFLVGVEGDFDWAVFGRPNIPLGTFRRYPQVSRIFLGASDQSLACRPRATSSWVPARCCSVPKRL